MVCRFMFLPLYYQEVIHPWFLDLGVDLFNSDSDKVDQIFRGQDSVAR